MFILLVTTFKFVLFLSSIAILNILAEAAIVKCTRKVVSKVIPEAATRGVL